MGEEIQDDVVHVSSDSEGDAWSVGAPNKNSQTYSTALFYSKCARALIFSDFSFCAGSGDVISDPNSCLSHSRTLPKHKGAGGGATGGLVGRAGGPGSRRRCVGGEEGEGDEGGVGGGGSRSSSSESEGDVDPDLTDLFHDANPSAKDRFLNFSITSHTDDDPEEEGGGGKAGARETRLGGGGVVGAEGVEGAGEGGAEVGEEKGGGDSPGEGGIGKVTLLHSTCSAAMALKGKSAPGPLAQQVTFYCVHIMLLLCYYDTIYV